MKPYFLLQIKFCIFDITTPIKRVECGELQQIIVKKTEKFSPLQIILFMMCQWVTGQKCRINLFNLKIMKPFIILGIYAFIFIFVVIPVLYILLLNFYLFIWLGLYVSFFVAIIFVIALIGYSCEIYKQFENHFDDIEKSSKNNSSNK